MEYGMEKGAVDKEIQLANGTVISKEDAKHIAAQVMRQAADQLQNTEIKATTGVDATTEKVTDDAALEGDVPDDAGNEELMDDELLPEEEDEKLSPETTEKTEASSKESTDVNDELPEDDTTSKETSTSEEPLADEETTPEEEETIETDEEADEEKDEEDEEDVKKIKESVQTILYNKLKALKHGSILKREQRALLDNNKICALLVTNRIAECIKEAMPIAKKFRFANTVGKVIASLHSFKKPIPSVIDALPSIKVDTLCEADEQIAQQVASYAEVKSEIMQDKIDAAKSTVTQDFTIIGQVKKAILGNKEVVALIKAGDISGAIVVAQRLMPEHSFGVYQQAILEIENSEIVKEPETVKNEAVKYPNMVDVQYGLDETDTSDLYEAPLLVESKESVQIVLANGKETSLNKKYVRYLVKGTSLNETLDKMTTGQNVEKLASARLRAGVTAIVPSHAISERLQAAHHFAVKLKKNLSENTLAYLESLGGVRINNVMFMATCNSEVKRLCEQAGAIIVYHPTTIKRKVGKGSLLEALQIGKGSEDKELENAYTDALELLQVSEHALVELQGMLGRIKSLASLNGKEDDNLSSLEVSTKELLTNVRNTERTLSDSHSTVVGGHEVPDEGLGTDDTSLDDATDDLSLDDVSGDFSDVDDESNDSDASGDEMADENTDNDLPTNATASDDENVSDFSSINDDGDTETPIPKKSGEEQTPIDGAMDNEKSKDEKKETKDEETEDDEDNEDEVVEAFIASVVTTGTLIESFQQNPLFMLNVNRQLKNSVLSEKQQKAVVRVLRRRIYGE